MRIISEARWTAIRQEREKLTGQVVELRKRAAALESTVTSLTLQAGLSGFEVQEKPASPARLVLRQVKPTRSN